MLRVGQYQREKRRRMPNRYLFARFVKHPGFVWPRRGLTGASNTASWSGRTILPSNYSQRRWRGRPAQPFRMSVHDMGELPTCTAPAMGPPPLPHLKPPPLPHPSQHKRGTHPPLNRTHKTPASRGLHVGESLYRQKRKEGMGTPPSA